MTDDDFLDDDDLEIAALRVSAFGDPEGEASDFVFMPEEPSPRAGLHFPPSDEFGYKE